MIRGLGLWLAVSRSREVGIRDGCGSFGFFGVSVKVLSVSLNVINAFRLTLFICERNFILFLGVIGNRETMAVQKDHLSYSIILYF